MRCRRGPRLELASAAVALIVKCDAERCFEDGLELMLAGLCTQAA
jgi:hypothetical protein